MALTTPILYSVSAFDATQAQTFLFNVLGGSQVVANTLIIKNNATLATVYSETQTTFKFEHALPANTLTIVSKLSKRSRKIPLFYTNKRKRLDVCKNSTE